MSRFGKALERANDGQTASPTTAIAPSEAPDSALFDAAWDVREALPGPAAPRPAQPAQPARPRLAAPACRPAPPSTPPWPKR